MVPTVSVPSAGATILFITFSDQPLLPTRERDKLLIRAFELECQKNAVALEKLVISLRPDGMLLRRHDEKHAINPRIIKESVGVVYFVTGGAA